MSDFGFHRSFPLKVKWVKGDATDAKTVEELLKDSDAAVHAIGKKNTVKSKSFHYSYQ